MKKLLCLLLTLALMSGMAACGGDPAEDPANAPTEAQEEVRETEEIAGTPVWMFDVGSDYVEEEAAGASEYDPTCTVNLKIVGAEDDVLFNGQVSIKTPTMWGNEFLKAAVTDKGLAQSGIEVGFVDTMGDYVNNSADGIYWMYTVNGQSPAFGCNLYQMRDGDYMLWTYDVLSDEVEDTAGPAAEPEWAFAVGSDYVEEEAAGASEYDPTFTVNLKILGAEEDVLYDGQVTLKSSTMWANEFLKAAVTDKGLAQSGIEVGFVDMLGDYVNNPADNLYWMYTVNGETPSLGSNLYQMRDGDYMLWTYDELTMEY